MSRRRGLSRSEQMARITGRNTEPEIALRRVLWADGLRDRIHYRIGRIRPDLAFPGARLAVFIDGCFWHGCPDHYVPPRSSVSFWSKKLRENVSRDQRQTAALEADGWCVLRFWEHEVLTNTPRVAERIKRWLDGGPRDLRKQVRVSRVEFLDDAGETEKRFLEGLRRPYEAGFELRERRTDKW